MGKCTKAVYDSRTYEIRQQITEGVHPFINQIYTNSNGFKWYVNARGYFHIYKIEPCKCNGNIYYEIQYYRLKPDGYLVNTGSKLFATYAKAKEAYDNL